MNWFLRIYMCGLIAILVAGMFSEAKEVFACILCVTTLGIA